MDIFAALRKSHDVQRKLCDELENTQGDSVERQEVFHHLKTELHAHAAAEERYFYIPCMERDSGLDLSRHAISEHHEMDELIEKLEEMDKSAPQWLITAKELTHKVRHHLEEEEHKFFQMAGKILNKEEKQSLSDDYLAELEEMREKLGQ
ncbi:hemerythrin domain-containing protein [Rappaport israeli]|uniref:hemerythrin domain-containing protein n=1 Tax=Rappaport israeli TaxID=1839807 RepID=UPI000931E5CF|nr:hemerythrin domain-containing protein [Rappaport israeli]